MAYRTIPDPLPKSPAGFFAATCAENVFVEKRPNWFQRTFTPFPYVYMDYVNPKETCRAHYCALSLSVALTCCGWVSTGFGLVAVWLVLMMLGFTGLFHMGLKCMEWKESI